MLERVCISAATSLLGKGETTTRNIQASEEASEATSYPSLLPTSPPLCPVSPQIPTNLLPCGLVNLFSSRHIQVNVKPCINQLRSKDSAKIDLGLISIQSQHHSAQQQGAGRCQPLEERGEHRICLNITFYLVSEHATGISGQEADPLSAASSARACIRHPESGSCSGQARARGCCSRNGSACCHLSRKSSLSTGIFS